MSEQPTYKVVPLPTRRPHARHKETPEEREDRIQAHMDRVQSMLDTIKLEEALAWLENAEDRREQALRNKRRNWKLSKQRSRQRRKGQ